MSHYWRGYRKGWYQGFILGTVFAVVLYSFFIIYWTGLQNIIFK